MSPVAAGPRFTSPMPQYLFTDASAPSGGLFLLDSKTGKVRRILTGSFRGLTHGPDGAWYLVTGTRSPIDGEVPPRSTVYRVEPDSWKAEPVLEHPVGDAHDL